MTGQAEFWDERYRGESFSFGTEPNAFLASQAQYLKPGLRVLVPGDGEGRNGVWLAQQWADRGDTVDASPVGVAKAQALAAERGVTVNAEAADLLDWDWPCERYDLVAALYIHFFDGNRPRMHRAMLDALKTGGILILRRLPGRSSSNFRVLHQSGGAADGRYAALQGQAFRRFRRRQHFAARRGGCGTQRGIPAQRQGGGHSHCGAKAALAPMRLRRNNAAESARNPSFGMQHLLAIQRHLRNKRLTCLAPSPSPPLSTSSSLAGGLLSMISKDSSFSPSFSARPREPFRRLRACRTAAPRPAAS